MANPMKEPKTNTRIMLVTIAGMVVIAAVISLLYAIARQEDESASGAGPAPASRSSTLTGPVFPPRFETVRINPNGDAVVAGAAPPRSFLHLEDGSQVVGQARADELGQWVLLPQAALAPGDHLLTLETRVAESVMRSLRSVLAIVPEPAKDIAGRPSVKIAGSLALEVTPGGKEADRLLQSPEPRRAGALALEILDYDRRGVTAFSGSAPPGRHVLLYGDNRIVAAVPSDEHGHWQVAITAPLPLAKLTLRIDLADQNAAVVERSEWVVQPLKFAENMAEGRMSLVQAGEHMWALAHRVPGDAVRYALVFAPDERARRDPGISYPGQLITLPQ